MGDEPLGVDSLVDAVLELRPGVRRWRLCEVVEATGAAVLARDMEQQPTRLAWFPRGSPWLAPPMTQSSINNGDPPEGFPVLQAHQVVRDEDGIVLGLEAGHALARTTPEEDNRFGLELRLHDWLDCLDSDQKWRLAQIVATHPSQVRVHYHGWSEKWDEWVPRLDSRKIKPPRKVTSGWTGNPKKKPDEPPSFAAAAGSGAGGGVAPVALDPLSGRPLPPPPPPPGRPPQHMQHQHQQQHYYQPQPAPVAPRPLPPPPPPAGPSLLLPVLRLHLF